MSNKQKGQKNQGQGRHNNNNETQHGSIGEKVIKEMMQTITVDTLDAMAAAGQTALASGLFSKDFEVPPPKGHWKFSLVPSSTGWDHRSLVLVPGDSRTRNIWTKGQITMAAEAGLCEAHARTWARSHLSRRHELLPKLVEVLKDEAKRDAYLEYGAGIAQAEKDKVEFNYHSWASKHGIKDGLSVTARKLLCAQIKELLDSDKKQAEKRQNAQPGMKLNPMLAQHLAGQKGSQETAKSQVATPAHTIIRAPLEAAGGLLPIHATATAPVDAVEREEQRQAGLAMAANDVIAEDMEERAPDEFDMGVEPEVEEEDIAVDSEVHDDSGLKAPEETAPIISSYNDEEDVGVTEVGLTAATVTEGTVEAGVDAS